MVLAAEIVWSIGFRNVNMVTFYTRDPLNCALGSLVAA